MDVIKLILTALLSVAAIFIITKIMGHKQVAQLDFFDYVSGITIGSVAAELATELEAPWRPLITLAIYGAVSVILNLITQKLPKTRKYLNGTPTILFNEGRLLRANLKKAKLDLSEFMLMCREQGYFDLGEIQTAVFEHNGKLSILPKSEYRPATPSDLSVPVKEAHVPTELIMDGRIMGENLKRMGRNEKWLKSELKSRGFKSTGEIVLALCHPEDGSLSVYPNE